MMGQLPPERLTGNTPAFHNTGVDLFGPYSVAIGRRQEKRWGILFTCLATRAVYIDLVPSLSTSDTIDALVRFNSRRGPAAHLWSDNGTNFKGADKEIRLCIQQWDRSHIRDKLLHHGTEWHFIPPSAPHMGGSWERLVGLTKKILGKIMETRTPKEYTLLTLLTEVENIINSRPLTVVSPDPADVEAITPNHLLKLKCGDSIPGSYEDAERHRKSWRIAQKLANEFWKRWANEYLPTLAVRVKWHDKAEPLREGDLVLLLDDQMERSGWRKGEIIKTYPGKDGQVRVVDVRVPIVTAEKNNVRFVVYKRPTVKVCPLGVNISDKTTS
ncbi:unnamed protein product [Orchesella dallaii]|uniref:Integrase catalytic domain-containing protein n=1 Tax=Orchesella dallaii TaxID=48710 RepID=A0ABP1Q508_9HEXA